MSKVYENLLKKGSVFILDISFWGGRKKLRAEEIGMNPDEVNDSLISLGSKYLIPKEEMAVLGTIRQKAYSTVEKFSIDIGIGKLVPESDKEKVAEDLNRLKEQFDDHLEHLKNEYPKMRHEMIRLWTQEAANISSSRNDPMLMFKIMGSIESAFPDNWDSIKHKFRFGFTESNDLDDIASQFVSIAVEKVAEQIKEFCDDLSEKIKDSGLHGKTINSIRNFLTAMRGSVGVFKSDALNDILGNMQNQISDPDNINPVTFKQAMAGISSAIEENMDEIRKDAVNRLTSQKGRNIEM